MGAIILIYPADRKLAYAVRRCVRKTLSLSAVRFQIVFEKSISAAAAKLTFCRYFSIVWSIGLLVIPKVVIATPRYHCNLDLTLV